MNHGWTQIHTDANIFFPIIRVIRNIRVIRGSIPLVAAMCRAKFSASFAEKRFHESFALSVEAEIQAESLKPEIVGVSDRAAGVGPELPFPASLQIPGAQ